MFCNNCGQQNAEGVRFCSSCGAPLMADAPAQAPVDADATVRVRVQPPVQEQYAPVQQAPYQAPVEQYAPVQQAPYQAPVQEAPYQAPAQQYAPVQQAPYQAPADPYAVPQYGAPAPQKSNGKMIGIIVGVVAAIAAVVVVLVLVLGGSSGVGASTPEEVAEKYIIAQIEYDAQALVDCMSDLTIEQTCKNMGIDGIDRDAVVEKLESTIPEDAEEPDYKIEKVERDNSLNKEQELEDIAEMFGQDAADKITDMCLVNVTITVDGEETTRIVTCIEENGKWVVAG